MHTRPYANGENCENRYRSLYQNRENRYPADGTFPPPPPPGFMRAQKVSEPKEKPKFKNLRCKTVKIKNKMLSLLTENRTSVFRMSIVFRIDYLEEFGNKFESPDFEELCTFNVKARYCKRDPNESLLIRIL